MERRGVPLAEALENCQNALKQKDMSRALEAIAALGPDPTLEALVRHAFGDAAGAEDALRPGRENLQPVALWLSAMLRFRRGDHAGGRIEMNRAWTNELPRALMLQSYLALFGPALPLGVAAQLEVESARAGGNPLDYAELMLRLGNLDDAARSLDALDGEDSRSPRALMARLSLLIMQGHPVQAKALMDESEEALRGGGFGLAADLIRDHLLLEAGEFGAVLARTEPAVNDALPIVRALQRMLALARSDRSGEAVTLARSMWRDPQTGLEERLALARMMGGIGQWEPAGECLREIKEPGAGTQSWFKYQLLMARAEDSRQSGSGKPRYARIRDACSRSCLEGRCDFAGYALWAHCCQILGEAAKARKILEFAVRQYPGSAQARAMLAQCSG